MIPTPTRPLPTLITAGMLTLTAGTACAVPQSSHFESHGYQACVKAVSRDVDLIRMDEHYFIYDHPDARRYYLNGYAFLDGDSESVKVACETTRSGGRVLTVSVDGGRYAGRIVDPVDVARN